MKGLGLEIGKADDINDEGKASHHALTLSEQLALEIQRLASVEAELLKALGS